MSDYENIPNIPVVFPTFKFLYDAMVNLDPMEDLGPSLTGHRRIVPIRGGMFVGPDLQGEILAGGADRQRVLSDDTLELDALYEMRTDDGHVITVRNQVRLVEGSDGVPAGYSNLTLTAPDGPYAWLNTQRLIGTVSLLHPEDPMDPKQVLIRAFQIV